MTKSLLDGWMTFNREKLKAQIELEQMRQASLIHVSLEDSQILESARTRLMTWRDPSRTAPGRRGSSMNDKTNKTEKPVPTATVVAGVADGIAKVANKKPTAVKPQVAAAVKPQVAAAVKPQVAAAVKPQVAAEAKGAKPVEQTFGPDPEYRTLKTIPELVDAYNEAVLTAVDLGVKKVATVKSFPDTRTGVLACERLYAQIKKARGQPDTTAEEEEVMTKKVSKKTAAKKGSKKTAAKKTAAKKNGTSRPRTKFDETRKIVALVKENPCRKGTGRYERVKNLLNHAGKTVGEFLKKGKAGTLKYSIDAKWVKLA